MKGFSIEMIAILSIILVGVFIFVITITQYTVDVLPNNPGGRFTSGEKDSVGMCGCPCGDVAPINNCPGTDSKGKTVLVEKTACITQTCLCPKGEDGGISKKITGFWLEVSCSFEEECGSCPARDGDLYLVGPDPCPATSSSCGDVLCVYEKTKIKDGERVTVQRGGKDVFVIRNCAK